MKVRRARVEDIPRLIDLLYQVHLVHSAGRPDIFKRGSKKYGEEELRAILSNEKTPVLVAVDGDGLVLGYSFAVLEEIRGDGSLVDRKSLYIDDICVDEAARGKHVGSLLYEQTLALARREGCYHVTLNVWALNEGAQRFYEKCGMTPLKTTMEKIL